MSIVIDARPISRDKTANDRQRFIRRAKNQIKEAVNRALNKGNIKALEDGKIQVPIKGLGQPHFNRDTNTGIKDRIFTGNREYVKGDSFKRPTGGKAGGGSGAGNGGDGEDDFVFTLTKDEFHEFFFEDLALPDLIKTTLKSITVFTRERAGYVTKGSISQLDVRQTYKYAFARQLALGRPTDEQLDDLELAVTEAQAHGSAYDAELAASVFKDAQAAQDLVPFIDDIDLRYRNYPPKPKPTTQAVMVCIMDVSGSMDEQRKDIAKRFFLLLNIMLMKGYKYVELVFIRHHTEAEETDEHDFFYKQESGGTTVSPALLLATKVIRERFANDWNVYVCHASDGDNWSDDNPKVEEALANLMPLVQYFAYLQVAGRSSYTPQDLWASYSKVSEAHKHLQLKLASSAEEVWPVFRELFKKA